MQRLFLLILMIGVSSFSSAQLLELNWQPHFYNYPTIMEVTANQDIIVAGYGRRNALDSDMHFLTFIDKEGNIKWEFNEFANVGEVHDIILAEDKIIVVGRAFHSCDATGKGFIYKFDYEGNVLFAVNDENSNGTWVDPRFAGLISNDELVILGVYGYEVWSSSDTLIFRETHFQLGRLEKIDRITDLVSFNNDLLITGYDEIWGNEDEEDNCTFLQVKIRADWQPYTLFENCRLLTDQVYKINKVSDSSYLLLGRERIYRSIGYNDDTDFYVQDESYNLGIYDTVINVQQKGEEVFLLVYNEEQYWLITLNEAFEFQRKVALKILPEQQLLDFRIIENKILFMGIEESYHTAPSLFYPDNSTASVFLKAYDLRSVSSFSYPVDIAITHIESEEPTTIDGYCNQYDYSCGTAVIMTYRNIQVEVSNKGTVPIHSFNLNARYDHCKECETFCGIVQVFQQKYEGLNLLPNESITITWDSIQIRNTPMVSEHDLCIWTTVPNQKLDGVKENDMHCQTFTVDNSLVTALDNIEAESMDDLSWKELISKGLTAQVYDINGRLIATLAKDQLEVEAFLNQLIAGIYVLHFRGENYQRAELYVRYY